MTASEYSDLPVTNAFLPCAVKANFQLSFVVLPLEAREIVRVVLSRGLLQTYASIFVSSIGFLIFSWNRWKIELQLCFTAPF